MAVKRYRVIRWTECRKCGEKGGHRHKTDCSYYSDSTPFVTKHQAVNMRKDKELE